MFGQTERKRRARLTTGLPTCTASQMFCRPWPSLRPDVRPCGWKGRSYNDDDGGQQCPPFLRRITPRS